MNEDEVLIIDDSEDDFDDVESFDISGCVWSGDDEDDEDEGDYDSIDNNYGVPEDSDIPF